MVCICSVALCELLLCASQCYLQCLHCAQTLAMQIQFHFTHLPTTTMKQLHRDTIITSGSPIRLTITVPEVVRTHLGGVAGFCFLVHTQATCFKSLEL